MTSVQVRKACLHIEPLIEGITLPIVDNKTAHSDSPIYCIPSHRRIYINKDKMKDVNILEKPELLMFLVLHEVQHINDNSLMAELRFDRQALELMLEHEIDITKINVDDFASLLNPTDSYRVARINQLHNYQNIVTNGSIKG
ncbi:hypothetical protein GCM10011514_16700 [Emticicia aquatilis]|uniref:Uncharacterized protein n=1 Tax=Emticicia aquatilis TaxID=1537369 RepID=A0A917DP80_9BACT|nr:hypothetical protein [Emticicia aquatilis]GGD53258.1 hypothetical protein GCM10011514_16700 [Emticicia aquatilis]